jgi:hypothetical protein
VRPTRLLACAENRGSLHLFRASGGLKAAGRPWLPSALGVVGVGDRPGESLDQLLCRMIVAEVGGVDLLIEQYWGLIEKC